ncbi:hypothetical protein GN956_G11931 [Arapaima gigas]
MAKQTVAGAGNETVAGENLPRNKVGDRCWCQRRQKSGRAAGTGKPEMSSFNIAPLFHKVRKRSDSREGRSLDLAAPQGERRYPEPQVPIDTPHLNPDLQELTNSQPRACCLERGTKDVEAARISKTVSRSYLEGIYTVVWVQGQAVCWRGELRCSVLALLNLRITMKTGITSVDDTPNSLLGLDLPTSRRQVIKRIPAGATLPFVSKASFSFSQLKSQHRVGGHGLSVHLYVRVYTKGS